MDSKTSTVDGIPIRWLEQGSGFPLVLVHGIPTSPSLWRHVLPLIPGARCLAFEMVGYGESIPQGVGRDISVARQADYLVAWLKQLGVERAVFAGHDLGGGVIQNVAVRQPDLCAGLFLTNAIGYDSWPIPSVKAMRATAPLVRKLPDAMTKQILRTLMYRGHDNTQLAREALDIHWRPYAEHGGAEALIRQIEALNVADTQSIAEALPNLQVPARIVWGAADQFQKLRYGQRFARDLRAPLFKIEKGKHFTPEDHPQDVAGAIIELLESVQ
jgi:pimeloyl-ACP methyl ester carboxylesterase